MSCTKFVTYKNLPIANLADEKVALLHAEQTIFLNAVNICNISKTHIRINLQIVRLLSSPIVTNFLIYNLLIQPNETVNLLTNLEVFLEDGDNLLCFSNGYSELFDCTVSYSILTES